LSYFGNIISGIAEILRYSLQIYTWVIIASVVISWVNAPRDNPLVRIIRDVTQPVLNYVRRYLPFTVMGNGIDLSPVVVILILWFAQSAIVDNLFLFAKTH
jgi:YggT family protein